jgi:hypothetical protein
MCDYTPDQVDADTEVSVNELVSHARDTLPWNVGVRILEINRKTLDRFSDDLPIADHGILRLAAGEKGVLPRCDIVSDTVDSIADVLQVGASSVAVVSPRRSFCPPDTG